MRHGPAKHALRTVVALLVLVALAGGCSRSKPVPRPARLVVGITDEPDMLNDMFAQSKSSRLVNHCIYSRFVCWDDSMHLVPDLLTVIPSQTNGGISPDDLTYTYHLRHDARWHDGVPLTSADVLFTYQAMVDTANGAVDPSPFDEVDHAEAPDSFTVVFRLKEPYAAFVSAAFNEEDVLPKHVLEKLTGAGFRSAAYQRAPVGSGPFRFKEWVPGSHIALVRNEAYYKGAPGLDEIVFKIVPEASALALQAQAGDVDVVNGAECSQVAAFASQPRLRVLRTVSLSFDQLTFNCSGPVLRDGRVRQALAALTDRGALATQVYGEGCATPALSDASPLMPWYDPAADTANVYDVKRAARLLEGAGWRDTNGDGIRDRGGKPLRLEISTIAGRPARERVQVVLQQAWRAAGIDLQIHNYSGPEFFEILTNGQFQIALFGWQQEPDPAPMDQVYGSHSMPPVGQNFARFRDARLDSLTALGKRQSAPVLRNRIYREVEGILAREVPALPLVWLTENDVVPAELRGFRPSPTSAPDTWNVPAWRLERSQ